MKTIIVLGAFGALTSEVEVAVTSEVDIVWEETAKGSKKIIAIQPAHEAQEDEGPDA